MLRNRGNDGNVNLGVASVPQRVESTAPRSNVSQRGKTDKADKTNAKGTNKKGNEERLELLARDGRANILDKSNKLKEAKDA